jgi:hypothetical protein
VSALALGLLAAGCLGVLGTYGYCWLVWIVKDTWRI